MRETIRQPNPEFVKTNKDKAEISSEELGTNTESAAVDTKDAMYKLNRIDAINQRLDVIRDDVICDMREAGIDEKKIALFESRIEKRIKDAKKSESEIKSDGDKLADAVFDLISASKAIVTKPGFWQTFSGYLKPNKVNNFDDVKEVYSRTADEGMRRSAYWMGHLREIGNVVALGSYFQAGLGVVMGLGLAALTSEYIDAAQVALASGVIATAEAFVGSVMQFLGSKQAKKLVARVQDYPKQYKAPDFGQFKLPHLIIQYYAQEESKFKE